VANLDDVGAVDEHALEEGVAHELAGDLDGHRPGALDQDELHQVDGLLDRVSAYVRGNN